MANIIITSYCNLHCPYCFANTMINTESVKNISIPQFKKILNWIGEYNEKIGLIGGEPTLHPQFKEILEVIRDYSERCNHKPHFVLFTNGIYLDKYLQLLPNNMEILINVNQPQAMTTQQFSKMLENISTMSKLGWIDKQVTFGCNICPQIDNYDFIWNICKRFKIKKLRMSVTAPTAAEQLKDKDKYYLSMKEKFLNFIDNAMKYRVLLTPDCNQIPPCYFTKEEVNKIGSVYVEEEGMTYPLCDPVIDITPEFKASSCFGAYQLIDCDQFDNILQLQRYMMYKVMYPKILNNCNGKCANCKKHDLMQCQGGCLAFGLK